MATITEFVRDRFYGDDSEFARYQQADAWFDASEVWYIRTRRAIIRQSGRTFEARIYGEHKMFGRTFYRWEAVGATMQRGVASLCPEDIIEWL